MPVTQTQARPYLSDSGGVEGLSFGASLQMVEPESSTASRGSFNSENCARMNASAVAEYSISRERSWCDLLRLRPPPRACGAASGNSCPDDAGADRACAQGRPFLKLKLRIFGVGDHSASKNHSKPHTRRRSTSHNNTNQSAIKSENHRSNDLPFAGDGAEAPDASAR